MSIDRPQVLCHFAELTNNTARIFQRDTPLRELFVVRRDERLVAYLNSCPHTGAPLDWLPGQLLNRAGDLIQCATHGALFRIADGMCIAGPCVGLWLKPITVAVVEGSVVLCDSV